MMSSRWNKESQENEYEYASFSMWMRMRKIDWLINGVPNCLGLFHVKKLWNCIHCTFIFTSFVYWLVSRLLANGPTELLAGWVRNGHWPANIALDLVVQFKLLSGICTWIHVQLGSSGSHCTKGADDQQSPAGFEPRLVPDFLLA